MADIVPVIYALRSSLNEIKSVDEQVESVADSMLRLERLFSNFDELEIVKAGKEKLSHHMLNNSNELNIKNHLQAKGFEPIKRSLVDDFIPTSLPKEQLLDFKFKVVANKKQKSSGFSYSFDFDNMPMFESLESMLVALRTNALDQTALEKILAMDLADLMDHHHWEELLLILYNSLRSSTNERHTLLVFTMLHRFIVGFTGSIQGLDTINCTLRYLFVRWILSSTESESNSHTTNSLIVWKSELALFVTILQCCSQSLQVPHQKEVDRAVVYIFLLLSKGTTHRPLSTNSSSSSNDNIATRTSPIISVLSCLSGGGVTVSVGDAISAMLKSVHPSSVFSYAISTGLLSSLLSTTDTVTHASTAHELQCSCFKMRLALDLLVSCGTNINASLRILGTCVSPTSPSGFDFSRFEFASGLLHSFDAPPVSVRDQTDTILSAEHTNKRFLKLRDTLSVFPLLARGNQATSSAGVILPFILKLLATLNASTMSNRDLIATLRIDEIVRLSLALSACCIDVADAPIIETLLREILRIESTIGMLEDCAGVCLTIRKGLLRGFQYLCDSAVTASRLCTGEWSFALQAVLCWEVLKVERTVDDVTEEMLRLFTSCLEFFDADSDIFSIACLTFAAEYVHTRTQHIGTVSTVTAVSSNASGVNNILPLCLCFLQRVSITRSSSDRNHLLCDRVLAALLRVHIFMCSPSSSSSSSSSSLSSPSSSLSSSPSSSSSSSVRSQLLELLQSGDTQQRGVDAIIRLIAQIPDKEGINPLLRAEGIDTAIISSLNSEFKQSDCFERALCPPEEWVVLPGQATTPILTVFPLLCELMVHGNWDVVGYLLKSSWGEEMGLSEVDVDLAALPLLHGRILSARCDATVQLESECVFPYILRLLYCGLQNSAYITALREVQIQLQNNQTIERDCDGEDLSLLFMRESEKVLKGSSPFKDLLHTITIL